MADLQEARASSPAVDLPLISLRRERRRWLQKLPHAIPALTLIGAGVNHLRNGEQGFGLALAVAELPCGGASAPRGRLPRLKEGFPRLAEGRRASKKAAAARG